MSEQDSIPENLFQTRRGIQAVLHEMNRAQTRAQMFQQAQQPQPVWGHIVPSSGTRIIGYFDDDRTGMPPVPRDDVGNLMPPLQSGVADDHGRQEFFNRLSTVDLTKPANSRPYDGFLVIPDGVAVVARITNAGFDVKKWRHTSHMEFNFEWSHVLIEHTAESAFGNQWAPKRVWIRNQHIFGLGASADWIHRSCAVLTLGLLREKGDIVIYESPADVARIYRGGA